MTNSSPTQPPPDRARRWLATGGIVAAIFASSCCIVPLALVTLGMSGAWIGFLTLLEPYKPIFIAIAATFIGFGFWRVYFRAKPKCADGSYCARPESSLITQIALWIAAAVVALAATIDWWAKFFY